MYYALNSCRFFLQSSYEKDILVYLHLIKTGSRKRSLRSLFLSLQESIYLHNTLKKAKWVVITTLGSAVFPVRECCLY